MFPAPAELTRGNYAGLVADEELLRSFWNTVLIAGPSTVLVVVIGALAAHALAWIDFPGRDWVLVVIVGLLVVAIQVALIPVARLLGATGLYGSIPGVVLFQVAFGLLASGAFLSMLVPLVVFFSFQRYFVQGILAGSTK